MITHARGWGWHRRGIAVASLWEERVEERVRGARDVEREFGIDDGVQGDEAAQSDDPRDEIGPKTEQ